MRSIVLFGLLVVAAAHASAADDQSPVPATSSTAGTSSKKSTQPDKPGSSITFDSITFQKDLSTEQPQTTDSPQGGTTQAATSPAVSVTMPRGLSSTDSSFQSQFSTGGTTASGAGTPTKASPLKFRGSWGLSLEPSASETTAAPASSTSTTSSAPPTSSKARSLRSEGDRNTAPDVPPQDP